MKNDGPACVSNVRVIELSEKNGDNMMDNRNV